MDRLICTLMLLLASQTLLAHEEGHEPQPAAIEENVQHAPSLLPDRIVLTWAGDPAHTQDVSWRTSTDVTQAYVEFAMATKGPYFTEHKLRIPAKTESFESDLGTYSLHTAQMAALAPATKYAYRVGDGTNWSEWFHFQTAHDQPAPFTFIYFGDAQNDVRSMWSRIIRGAYADAPKAAFMLHAGDLVNRAHRDAEWGEWFGAGNWVNAMMPSIATPGNHEYHKEGEGEEEVRTLSKHWQPTFAFPRNGPDGLEESTYYFDYQGVRFISLNSNEQHEVQAAWLEQVLEENRSSWTIVTFHHPMYSSAVGRDNVDLRRLWKPILDKHHVDLVLQGHDHSYARSGLALPESANLDTGINVKDGPTVYVVSVSGPKQYDVEGRGFFQRAAAGAQLYQIIHVENDSLTYEARVANGELYDAFTLRKRTGQFNELIDRSPDTPESRRPAAVQIADKKRRAAELEKYFQSRDVDKDGKLAGDEIPSRIKMENVDTNSDGAVTLEEIRLSLKKRRGRKK